MSYIRLTVAAPPPERVAEVRGQYEDLLAYLTALPGFINGWVVSGHGEGEIGRLTVWQDEAAANRAATDSHVLALHARVLDAAAGHVWDRSFASEGPAPREASTAPALDPVAAVRAAEVLLRHAAE